MYKEILTVEEQQPADSAIWCDIKIDVVYRGIKTKGSTSYGNMNFVCNTEKVITQYHPWIKEPKYKRQLIKLGYRF